MPIFLPQDSVIDTSEFDRPKTPISEAFGDSINESLSTGPTEDIALRATQFFAPGNKISNDEYKKSEYFRPGIEYPSGVGENIARVRANAYDRERERSLELSLTNDGIVSKGAKLSGSLIGSALDPINIAAAVGTAGAADYLIGIKSAAVLEKLNELPAIASRAAKTAAGAIEGAVAVTPAAVAQYDVEQQLDMDPSAVSILATIGIGVGFGGVIRGIAGYRLPIKPEADSLAKQTAVHQLSEGKSVNVSDIIQQGFFDQHQIDAPSSLLSELEDKHSGDIESFLKEIDESLKKKSEDLESATSREESARFVHGLSSEHKIGIDSPLELTKAIDALNTPSFERNANQVFLLNNLPSGEEFRRALEIGNTPAFNRLADENIFIKSFLRGDEKEIIYENILRHEDNIKKIDNEIEKLNPKLKRDIKTKEVLLSQKKQLNDRINIANDRLKHLKGEPSKLTASDSIKNDIESLSKTKNALIQLKNEIELNRVIKNKSVSPGSVDELKANSDKVHAWSGDSAINEEMLKHLENELSGVDIDINKNIQELEDDIKGLSLDEEDKAALDTVKEDEVLFKKVSKALLDLANCLRSA